MCTRHCGRGVQDTLCGRVYKEIYVVEVYKALRVVGVYKEICVVGVYKILCVVVVYKTRCVVACSGIMLYNCSCYRSAFCFNKSSEQSPFSVLFALSQSLSLIHI